MATSGSINYSNTRNEIIADALIMLGVYRPGDTVSSNDYTYCSSILNKMIKQWESQGTHVWKLEEGALFLTDGQGKYTFSSTTTDKIGRSPTQTALTADCTSTTATVTSTIGMTASDNIGIALDANTIHWTTIVSVDSTTQVTLTAAPATTASSGNAVFTYTNAVIRPLQITSARLQEKSGNEREIEVLGHDEFMMLNNKQTEGTITAIHYQPRTSTGLMYVYQLPSTVNECIRFTYVRSIEDFDASSDDLDMPQEWLYPVTVNLAVKVATTYNKDLTNSPLIVDAANSLQELKLYNVEEGSVRIVPNDRWDY